MFPLKNLARKGLINNTPFLVAAECQQTRRFQRQ